MKRDANLSPMDRAVRVFLGVALLVAGLIVVPGLPGAALDVVGAMLIFSGSVGFCHIYRACGISTVKKP